MKTSEIQAAVLSGARLVAGTFQDWEVRETPDKKTPGAFNVVQSLFIMSGREVLPVEAFLPSGTRKADVQPPAFKKGQLVVVRWTGYEKNKYGIRVRGTVESLEG